MFQRLPKFEYLAPSTVQEACAILGSFNGEAKLMAGGTNLLPQMKWRFIKPAHIVGLTNIPGLDSITYGDAQGLRLGALTTIRSLEQSATVREMFTLLAEAASRLGSVEVRNVATVGGNLCNASPSANTALPLIALDATVKLVSVGGERLIPLESFFKGPGQTVLGSAEMLTEVQVSRMRPGSAGSYMKLTTRNTPVDRPIVAVAALIARDPGSNACNHARIVLGGAAPMPVRAKTAESALLDRELNDEVIAEAAVFASKEAQPISDVSASADYKRNMVEVFTRRALARCFGQLRQVG